MRTLLIYYSKTGRTAAVASALEAEIVSRGRGVMPETVRVKRRREASLLACATEARRHECPEIVQEPLDLTPFDLVLLGFPTWGFCAASPVNTVVAGFRGTRGQKFCLFATSGFAQGYVKALDEVSRDLQARGGIIVCSSGFPNRSKSSLASGVSSLVAEALVGH